MFDFGEFCLIVLSDLLATAVLFGITAALWGPEVSMLIAVFGTVFVNLLRLALRR